MYKCKVCGKEFELRKEEHYVARDKGSSGIAKVIVSNEESLYDSFDCPHCGCQNVTQERKRNYVPYLGLEETETETETEEEERSNEDDWFAEVEDEKEERNGEDE